MSIFNRFSTEISRIYLRLRTIFKPKVSKDKLKSDTATAVFCTEEQKSEVVAEIELYTSH